MIPPKTHFVWRDLVVGRKQVQFQNLATRILLMRLLSSAKFDASTQNISKCIDEFHQYFVKNEKIVQADVNQILR